MVVSATSELMRSTGLREIEQDFAGGFPASAMILAVTSTVITAAGSARLPGDNATLRLRVSSSVMPGCLASRSASLELITPSMAAMNSRSQQAYLNVGTSSNSG